MNLHLKLELEQLTGMVRDITDLVLADVHRAVEAFQTGNTALARDVIQRDRDIDRMEVRIEEECLKIMALHQPVANDLRYLFVTAKVNHELERIGDLAADIAKCAVRMAELPALSISLDLTPMADAAIAITQQGIQAYVTRDPALARQVWFSDQQVDDLHKRFNAQIVEQIMRRPSDIPALLHVRSVTFHLERMADHAANIAKDVIYLVEAEIARHRRKEFQAKACGNAE